MVLASLFVGTAGVLAWLGTILSQADLEAMDGFQRVLFSVVPIRPFSFVFATVFGFLGVRLGLRGWRGRPALVISTDGFTIGGELQPWSRLKGATNPKGDHLVLEFLPAGGEASAGEEETPETPPPSKGTTRVTLSQFDLGAEPRVVVEAIDRMRGDGV